MNLDRSQEKSLALYSDLVLVRECEERIRSEYATNDMKTPVHLGIGGEAVAVGIGNALPKSTRYFATYRNHSIFLTLSKDTDSFFGELYGKITGCGKGKAGSMHLSAPKHGLIATSAVVGTTIPIAVGAALANQYSGKKELVCTFFGDGAVEEGAFWESLNFAALKKLPVLFVVEDNDLAIHTSRSNRQGFESIEKIVAQFPVELGSSDGTDVHEVHELSEKISSRMMESGRPGLIYLPYHRFLEHVGPNEDYPAGYRQKPDSLMENFDPVLKCQQQLFSIGVDPQILESIRTEVLKKIDVSVERAKAAPFPEAEELYRDVFSSPSPTKVKNLESETEFAPPYYLNRKQNISIEEYPT